MKKKGAATTAAGLVGGAVAANFVQKQAANMFPAVGKYSGAIPVVLGYFLEGMKGDFVKAVGAGMIAAGGANLIGGFVPAVAAPVSDEVLADAIITEDLTGYDDSSAVGELEAEMSEDLTEDLTEDLSEDLTEELA